MEASKQEQFDVMQFDASQAAVVSSSDENDVDVVDSAFFAPAATDMLDSLLGQYKLTRHRISEVAAYVKSETPAAVLHYFLDGNHTEDRGRRTLELSTAQLFQEEGAVASLNAAYWSKALAMTDVLDLMPQKRRDEWHAQIRNPQGVKGRQWKREWESADVIKQWEIEPLPAFEESTVRNTLVGLLNMRTQFLAERVDGIFRGLSGEHVTNAPEAFGKRMIIAYVLNSYGSTEHSRTGLINDLRCVIAKFMGRDEPRYRVSDRLINTLRGRWGEWVSVDGGALRIRLYKKGTAHLEVHPDMAWRLNMVLAHLHPTAIPAEFRRKPVRKPKDVPLMKRPLPFRVLEILDGATQTRQRVSEWPERYADVPNTITLGYVDDADKHARAEAEAILAALGGTELPGGRWEFDYYPIGVIHEIVNTGCIPDQKAHQFYPTPTVLAERVIELAEIGEHDTCLEPSAGIGGLADFMPKDRTLCIEVSGLHCKVLEAKGFTVKQADFLKCGPNGAAPFDVVVMNPPFADGRALAHLEHAASMVAAGGRVVAILPASLRGNTLLPGFEHEWSARYDNEFPGTTVSVAILTARKAC